MPTETPTIRRDKLLVVDIEASCWRGSPPPGQQNEIIEVGLCLLELADLMPKAKRSVLVKPTRSKISDFCTELTTLTQEQVDSGVNFAEACRIIEQEYAAKQLLWCSWGNYDLNMFKAQCESFAVPYPFSKRHVNIKKVFAKHVNNRKQMGMARALKAVNLPLEGTHHRGGDDAWNIARLTAYLLKEHGRPVLDKFW